MKIAVTLHFPKGYIAHPYWPAREKLINIQKQSGMNRVRSEDRRTKSLKAWLDAHGMSMDQYRAIEQQANRAFYTIADVNGIATPTPPPPPSTTSTPSPSPTPAPPPTSAPSPTPSPTSEIVIPAHQLYGMLAQAASIAPSSIRFASPEQIRTLITWGDLRTGRFSADGTWERYVPVKSGTGQALSNQRGLRSDAYLADLKAHGVLTVVQEDRDQKARQFIEWAGAEVGVGACRKMGWGRFVVTEWQLKY